MERRSQRHTRCRILGGVLFSILLMPLVMGHMAHLGMTLKTVVRAK